MLGSSAMRIIALSSAPNSYTTRRLVAVARRRGHSVRVLDPLRLSLSIVRGLPRLTLGTREVEPADAVIPRLGASTTHYGLGVLRQLETLGAVPLNGAEAIASCRDKLRCLQILSRNGIRLPDTALTRTSHEAGAVLEESADQAAWVIKLLAATPGGQRQLLAESRRAATSLMEAFHQLDEQTLVQRLGAGHGARRLRALVVGKEVVACPGRPRRTGARRRALERQLERQAVLAAAALGLEVAGVDLLVMDDGQPLVLDVTPCPGLEAIERESPVNAAGRVIDHLERLHRRTTRDRLSRQRA